MAQAATLAMVDPKVAEFVTGSRRMLIDGAWVEAASGKTFPVYDPATKVASGQLSHPFVLSQYFFLGNWQWITETNIEAYPPLLCCFLL